MERTPTPLSGVMLIQPVVHRDARGLFLEIHHTDRYRDAGLDVVFVQDNLSCSRRGVLRGLHFQSPCPQGKLVMVLRGDITDVIVDIRRGSPTFGQHLALRMTADAHQQLWIPPGLAHGFVVHSDTADVLYKCTERYRPDAQRAIRWDDPDLGIDWGISDPILSPRDAAAPPLSALTDLPRWMP
ncbi:MAG: dTDP-4-dehydrorhamnose 3,5-epimerase [Myxococcota bacterium]